MIGFLLPPTSIRPIHSVLLDRYLPHRCGEYYTNPSLVSVKDGYVVAVRSVNYIINVDGVYVCSSRSGFFSKTSLLWCSHNLSSVEVIAADILELDQIEDVRLFKINDRILGLGSRLRTTETGHTNEMTLIVFKEDFSVESVSDIPSPRGANREKNWSPFPCIDGEAYVYQYNPFVILRRNNGEITLQRGACNLIGSKRLWSGSGGVQEGVGHDLGLAHAHYRNRRIRRTIYENSFALIDRENLRATFYRRFYIGRRGIQFINGFHKSGEQLVISYGQSDCSAHLSIFDVRKLVRLGCFPSKRNFNEK